MFSQLEADFLAVCTDCGYVFDDCGEGAFANEQAADEAAETEGWVITLDEKLCPGCVDSRTEDEVPEGFTREEWDWTPIKRTTDKDLKALRRAWRAGRQSWWGGRDADDAIADWSRKNCDHPPSPPICDLEHAWWDGFQVDCHDSLPWYMTKSLRPERRS